MSKIKLTILGCGTSTGVPLISCRCAVCRSRNKKNHRLRASVWLQVAGKSLLVDTSPDFRQQALREKIQHIDAVLYTHPHADHIHGIDELRSYNYIQKQSIPVFCNEWTAEELRVKFSYIFRPQKAEGGGVPMLDLNTFKTSEKKLTIAGVDVIPISLQHGSKECVGYRVGSLAYVTDCSFIPPESLERLKGLDVLVLDCLRYAPHGTHFNFEQSMETIAAVRPKKTVLTHLGHDFDYPKMLKKLPKRVTLAYDGMKISAPSSVKKRVLK